MDTGVDLGGRSVRVASGATLDLSGGGELLGAGFVSGRGGSTDARYNPLVRFDEEGRFDLPGLADNPIYAIVPGVQRIAPVAAEGGASTRWSASRSASVAACPACRREPTPCCRRLTPCCPARTGSNSTARPGWDGQRPPSSCAAAPGRWPGSCPSPAPGCATNVPPGAADPGGCCGAIRSTTKRVTATSPWPMLLAVASRGRCCRWMRAACALTCSPVAVPMRWRSTAPFQAARGGYGGSLAVLGNNQRIEIVTPARRPARGSRA